MRLCVNVLHNVSQDMFLRYDPATSALYHAYTFDVEADSVQDAANLVWVLANVDDADHLRQNHPHLARYAPQVTAYRARLNRSLSVSDVLVFHEGPRFAGALVVGIIGHWELGSVPTYTDTEPQSYRSASFRAHEKFRETFQN